MIAARRAIDLRPKLERLDELLLRSAGVDPAALSFEFRPLWQMDAAAAAAIALQKAQATQIYAGLNLWPAAVTARLVQSQLVEDGIYPGAEGMFEQASASPSIGDAFPAYLTEPREANGRWTAGEGASLPSIDPIAFHIERERRRERKRRRRLERERARRESLPEERSEPSEGAAHERPQASPQPEAAAPNPEPPAPPSQAPASALPSSAQPFPPPPAVFKPEGIPDYWLEKPTDSEGGLKWSNPDNPNQNVRSMPGNPNSQYPHQKIPYIVHQDGSYRDVNGDPILGQEQNILKKHIFQWIYLI